MNQVHTKFDEHEVLHDLQHYLPAQAPLKDFVHHNTLHAFQSEHFFDALHKANQIFGYKTILSLTEFRELYKQGKIKKSVLDFVIKRKKGEGSFEFWQNKLLIESYDGSCTPRIGSLRGHWKTDYAINLDKGVHTTLFRVLCSYLDQGISIWNFPAHENGFLASIKLLEKNNYMSFFKTQRAKDLLFKSHLSIQMLLDILVNDEDFYEQYLFDQQFLHPGWSGIVSTIEQQPASLLDKRKITLKDFILFELLLEIDALDAKFGENWLPLGQKVKSKSMNLFAKVTHSELFELQTIWQEAFEFSFYDEVLLGIQYQSKNKPATIEDKSFQALFCMDDRECSIRRHVESVDEKSETFGTPGFFNVEFFYQPLGGKFYTKLCPAPVTPQYLIKEVGFKNKRETDVHFTKHSHGLFFGWIISQTLGFWSAMRLFLNIFSPKITPATSTSFRHLDKKANLTIENVDGGKKINGLQLGFTPEEMADRVAGLLKSIGLVKNFAPIVYVVGHGATSINNTHYAGYDCGACCGRPGSVNAKVFAFMANHIKVRTILQERGIVIPSSTQFVGALHDTTRDEIIFYDEEKISSENSIQHRKNIIVFETALGFNAKERSRRFESIDSSQPIEKVHEKVKKRSVSLFEPRPELNHATNALCVVGSRDLSKKLFLDRRSFMNSYDYSIDLEGEYLFGILKAIAPVGGGINLEYYFSRVDNQKLGAGTKLPHNVMGLIGVANGIDGDLRTGLPSQMIEVHDPVRLLVIVEHYPEVVLKTIQKVPETYQWFKNEWVRLVAVHPQNGELFLFEKEKFVPYQALQTEIKHSSSILEEITNEQGNMPVLIIN